MDLSLITNGMYKVANSAGGTARLTFNRILPANIKDNFCIYAKTGTAQISRKNTPANNAWIAGFYYTRTKSKGKEENNGCKITNETKKKIYSFSCSVKIVPSELTGGKVCGDLIAKIIKEMYQMDHPASVAKTP